MTNWTEEAERKAGRLILKPGREVRILQNGFLQGVTFVLERVRHALTLGYDVHDALERAQRESLEHVWAQLALERGVEILTSESEELDDDRQTD